MTLAEYLTRLKNDTDYTFQNLSDMTGIHINTIQNILNGKTKSTTMDKAQKLTIALGGSLDMLQKLDYLDGDSMAADVQTIPSDSSSLAVYTMSVENRMQYQAAIFRERKLNKTLTLALICTSVILFLLTVAIIALFTYDLTHPDRGWYQALQRLTAHV